MQSGSSLCMLIVFRPSYSGQRRTDFTLSFRLQEVQGRQQEISSDLHHPLIFTKNPEGK
jgi:hypothetical protein